MGLIKHRDYPSVPDSLPAPLSLKNILKELEEDLGPRPFHDLTSWAEQGVLLLNACLTVPAVKQMGTPVRFGNLLQML